MRNVITSTMGTCHKRSVVVAIFMLVLLLSACGDDDSGSVAPNNEPSSSSVIPGSDPESGNSVKSSNSSADEEKFSSAESSSSVMPQSNSGEKNLSSSSSAGVEKFSSAESSSSVMPQSSSSEKDLSSSSIVPTDDEPSSSSVIPASSEDLQSSSSKKPESSSSIESSSSSANNVDCSALLEEEKENGKWSWDIPKECRFNPNIDYGTMTDERDYKVYRTVKIGNQVWMAENLNYSDSSTTPSLKGKSWCYNREPKNCDVTGRLYTWAAAIDSVKLANDADNPLDCGSDKICGLSDTVQGICPPGWHLPSYAEWDTLVLALGGRFNVAVGTLLKSQSGWDKGSGNGTDAFGFCALPAGVSYINTVFAPSGEFDYGGNETNFWSSTEEDDEESYSAVCMNLYTSDGGPFRELKNAGISVRCLKN